MHIVNHIESLCINCCQIVGHILKPVHDLVIVQIFACNRLIWRCHLLSGYLIDSTVYSIQQALCKVCPGAEELHLLSDPHRRYAAGNSVVITQVHTHKVVVLVLYGAGLDRDVGCKMLEVGREPCAPKDSQVRLGSRPQVLQGVEEPVAHLGHHMPSVEAHTA